MSPATVVCAGVLGLVMLTGCERPARVVGARRDLRAGTKLTLSDVQPVVLETAPRPTLHIEVERAARVIGATLARDVREGQAITVDDLVPHRTRVQRVDTSRQRRGGRGRRASA